MMARNSAVPRPAPAGRHADKVARRERLAAALRENLKRRKAQGRARAAQAERGTKPDGG